MPKAAPLTEDQIAVRLSQLTGWERDGMVIRKTYKLDTYMTGLAFAAAVGTLCEARDHHPDLYIGWKQVQVSFTTHDAGNSLTTNDFDAAQAIDALGYPKGGTP
jgi:4a-hydroxytetrahydrobiopterin dehydratase